MKRKTQSGTGLYDYLNSLGVLENGSDEDIKRCKEEYWKEYRKAWKKNKRQQSKRYVLLFSFKEAKSIAQKAEILRITPAKAIKLAVLGGEQPIGPVLIGEIREHLKTHTQLIQTTLAEPQISGGVKAKILASVYRVEKAVLGILNRNKQT